MTFDDRKMIKKRKWSKGAENIKVQNKIFDEAFL